jgi:6-pyruvoyltetrahydropterin/6-carboxytetrahydropterin synthase
MFAVAAEVEFAAAHALTGYSGPCENLHGHNYRVRLQVSAPEVDALGMVLDFVDLKRILKDITAPLDHRNLNDVEPFTRKNPTAEHLARHIYEEARKRIAPPLMVTRVEVYETPTSCATYESDPEEVP